ncbi:MAG: zinc-binding dehydrogenase, partial [Bryobacteraceae bacterium]
IGLLTIAALKLAGAGRIWAIEPLDWRRDLAHHMGAAVAIDPEDADAAPEILRETKGRGVDVAIDCAAKDNTANECIQVSCNGGRVVYTGIPVEVEVPLEFHAWRRKELTLFQVRRSNHEPEAARDMLAAHLKLFAPLITHQRPLSEIAGAFEQVEHYGGGVAKLVVG